MQTFDPSADFTRVADGLETVTLARRGGAETTIVLKALRRAVVPLPGTAGATVIEGSVTTWHLPAGEISPPPRPGDRVIDTQGRRWTVMNVWQETRDSRWRCQAIDLTVACGLDAHVTIEMATSQKGKSGAPEPTWSVMHAGLRAGIQPRTARPAEDLDHRATRAQYDILLEDEIELDPLHRYRVLGSDGAVYTVVDYEPAASFDRLGVIHAQRVTPPN